MTTDSTFETWATVMVIMIFKTEQLAIKDFMKG